MANKPVHRVEGEVVACTRCGERQAFTDEFFPREHGALRMPCRGCNRNIERRRNLFRPRMRGMKHYYRPMDGYDERDGYERETSLWWRELVREVLAEMYPLAVRRQGDRKAE